MTGGDFLWRGWEIIGDEFFAKEWIESANDGVVEAGTFVVSPSQVTVHSGDESSIPATRNSFQSWRLQGFLDPFRLSFCICIAIRGYLAARLRLQGAVGFHGIRMDAQIVPNSK